MPLFETFPYTNFQDLNLNRLIEKMKELLAAMKELQSKVGGYEGRIRQLEDYINKLNSGRFPQSFLDALYKWLRINVPDIIADVVKQVWFGLTDEGHFCAYIPDSWKEIAFYTTGYDIELALQPAYGHLVLASRNDPVVYGGKYEGKYSLYRR